MRNLITIIVIGAIGFAIYNSRTKILRKLNRESAPTQAVAPSAQAPLIVHFPKLAPASTPEIAAAPAPESPAAQSEAVAPPQPQVKVAPPGSYFLTQRVSVITNDGVIAAMPGELVKLLYRNKNGTVRVMLGKQNLEVREDQLTKEQELDGEGRPIVRPNVPKGAVAAQK